MRRYRAGSEAIVWLNRKPLDQGGAIPVKVGLFKGSVVAVCPVDKLNDVPKGLPFSVQAEFFPVENFGDNNGLLTKGGILYVWDTAIRRLVRGLSTRRKNEKRQLSANHG